jgi:hypothetical protein
MTPITKEAKDSLKEEVDKLYAIEKDGFDYVTTLSIKNLIDSFPSPSGEWISVKDTVGFHLMKTKIFESLGEVSMCWIPRPSNQVFDSTNAERIGNELLDFIINSLKLTPH